MLRPSLFLLGTLVVSIGALAARAQSGSPLTPITARLGVVRPAPAWRNSSWLNAGHPVSLESLRGRVVLLNFWTFTCWNCTGAIPSMVEFDNKYRSQGLTLIGIHTPEFPPYAGEHDKGNVAKALAKYRIEYPNAQDNDSRTWDLYGIRYWPSYVLIDKKGQIRHEGYGEFHLNDASHKEWQRRIEALLAEEG